MPYTPPQFLIEPKSQPPLSWVTLCQLISISGLQFPLQQDDLVLGQKPQPQLPYPTVEANGLVKGKAAEAGLPPGRIHPLKSFQGPSFLPSSHFASCRAQLSSTLTCLMDPQGLPQLLDFQPCKNLCPSKIPLVPLIGPIQVMCPPLSQSQHPGAGHMQISLA